MYHINLLKKWEEDDVTVAFVSTELPQEIPRDVINMGQDLTPQQPQEVRHFVDQYTDIFIFLFARADRCARAVYPYATWEDCTRQAE